MTQTLAIIGILGSVLCVIADCLFDLKGADNIKLGKRKEIDSKSYKELIQKGDKSCNLKTLLSL